MNALMPVLRRSGLVGHPGRDLFDRFFEDFGLPSLLSEEATFVPAFDVSETESELIVRVEVPGIDKKDITVNLSDDVLTIKGEKKQEREDKNENYHSVERLYGTFSRSMRLPVEVDADKVEATYKDGVLKVTLAKSEGSKVKTIEIKH